MNISMPAATGPTTRVQTRQAAALFLGISILLGVMLVMLVLVTIARRLRRQRVSTTPTEPLVDPWEEAGRRAEPIDGKASGRSGGPDD